MMNELRKTEIIKREELDELHYFNSLMEKGYEKALLNIQNIENLKIQSIELLKKRTQLYNGTESSSIPMETANMIMESNIYTIGFFLKTLEPDNAITKFTEMTLFDMYVEGKRLIKRAVKVNKLLHHSILRNKIITQNETYNSTINGGIKGFFKLYNPDFEADKIKITADYPLYNNLIGKLEGIEFIEEYLKSIYLENEFCRIFNNKNIDYLLYGYSSDFRELIINVFSIVLTAIVGCYLAEEDVSELTVSNSGITKIYNKLKGKSKFEIDNILLLEYQKLREKYFSENDKLDRYVIKGYSEIQYMVWNALQNNSLEKVFVVKKIFTTLNKNDCE